MNPRLLRKNPRIGAGRKCQNVENFWAASALPWSRFVRLYNEIPLLPSWFLPAFLLSSSSAFWILDTTINNPEDSLRLGCSLDPDSFSSRGGLKGKEGRKEGVLRFHHQLPALHIPLVF